jgi:hypothetical protein
LVILKFNSEKNRKNCLIRKFVGFYSELNFNITLVSKFKQATYYFTKILLYPKKSSASCDTYISNVSHIVTVPNMRHTCHKNTSHMSQKYITCVTKMCHIFDTYVICVKQYVTFLLPLSQKCVTFSLHLSQKCATFLLHMSHKMRHIFVMCHKNASHFCYICHKKCVTFLLHLSQKCVTIC